MYSLYVKPELDKKFDKLAKKDKVTWGILWRKLDEIVQNPQHYKNLRAPLQHWKRVHIRGSFVLAFSVDENTKTVTLEDFDFHDSVYWD